MFHGSYFYARIFRRLEVFWGGESARVATKRVRGDFDFSNIVLYCNGIAI